MLSIITPHYNNFKGVKRLYKSLMEQTSTTWEWLVIDDLSPNETRIQLIHFFNTISNSQIKLVLNDTKTNASVCRNIGMEKALYDTLVFLDSDDFVSKQFVANRLFDVQEFVVFKNYFIKNEKGTVYTRNEDVSEPLESFLQAKFIWQTSCVLWNKNFLKTIGKFDPQLDRLQDVELMIRALQEVKNVVIKDNEPDFFYCTKPIRLKPHIVKESCESVNYLVSKLNSSGDLSSKDKFLLRSYYYACVKALHRSNHRTDVSFVWDSLRVFYKNDYFNFFEFLIGAQLLLAYRSYLLPRNFFLKANRYFFK